jgi:hypothetical protein
MTISNTPGPTEPYDPREGVVHRCPVPYAIGGDGLTQCCHRSPFELHTKSRMTTNDTLVTCKEWKQ